MKFNDHKTFSTAKATDNEGDKVELEVFGTEHYGYALVVRVNGHPAGLSRKKALKLAKEILRRSTK